MENNKTLKDAPRPVSLKKELPALLCLLLALALFCCVVLRILTPKRMDYGAVWGMYGEEKENTIDILFYGSSLTYCDIIPSEIYKNTGIATYIMAGPEQTMPITYRYFLESLKTQSPKAVFIEATGMLYDRSNRSIKANLMYMPWGMNRLIPTIQETEGEERIELLFPVYSYHDRWDKVGIEEIRSNLHGYDADLLAGYTFLTTAEPIAEITERTFSEDPDNYRRNLEYAEKIVERCLTDGIKPIFFISPTSARMRGDVRNQLEEDLTALGAAFVDFNDDFEKLSLDFSTDFYDKLHLNCLGAEKFSRYLAERLTEWGYKETEYSDRELWENRIAHYTSLREGITLSPQS